MGQLFDRLKNFVKVSAADLGGSLDHADRIIDADDEELRRIIDELHRGADSSASTGSRQRQTTSSGPRPKAPSIPPDVATAARVLGVSPTAHISEIRKAWRQRISAVHPDRMQNRPPAEQVRAQQEAQAINAAWSTLQRYHETR
ncbi:MAG: J domain-containing protein [Candidatus Kapabacteria bacterium]|jgi:DnaJ-domain-containing protein 1|nr:J domain-containing protein [Candidatus Kapabacteria bacterium]